MSLQLITTPTGEVALVVNNQIIIDGEAEDASAKLAEQTAERLAVALNEPLQVIQVEPTAADWTWDALLSQMLTSAASQERSSAEVAVTAFCYTTSCGGTGLSDGTIGTRYPHPVATVRVSRGFLDDECGYRFVGEAADPQLTAFRDLHGSATDKRVFFSEFDLADRRDLGPLIDKFVRAD